MSQESDASQSATAAKEMHHGLSDRFVTFAAIGIVAVVCMISWWLAVRAAIPGAFGAPLG